MQHKNIEQELLKSFTDSDSFDLNTLQKMEAYGQKYPWFGLSNILGAKAAVETEVDSTLFSKTGIFCSKPIWLAGFLSKTKVVLQNEVPFTNSKEESFSFNSVELKNEVALNEALNVADSNIEHGLDAEVSINATEKEMIKEQLLGSAVNIDADVLPITEVENKVIENELIEIKHETVGNGLDEIKDVDVDLIFNKEQLNIENELVENINITEKGTTEELKKPEINIENVIEIPVIEEVELKVEPNSNENALPLSEVNDNINALSSALALAEDQELPVLEENNVEEVKEKEKDLLQNIDVTPLTNIAVEQYDYDAAQSFDIPALPTKAYSNIESLAANSAAELKTTFIKPALEINEASNIKKDDKTSEKLEFEPYHTVDYFAAVGIKIDDKLLQNDRIGQQLRSFNDWLKTMKNLHPEKLLENNLHETQGLVEIKTLDDEEVITEAMAIVYLKQGRKDKAVELLAKLSLLNSSKTTYFANLIQEYNNK